MKAPDRDTKRRARRAWRWATAAAVVAGTAAPADAFYWKGWPAGEPQRPPTLIPAGASDPGVPPVDLPPVNGVIDYPGDVQPGAPGQPGAVPPTLDDPVPVGAVPEPATALLAATGLAAAGLARWRKGKRAA